MQLQVIKQVKDFMYILLLKHKRIWGVHARYYLSSDSPHYIDLQMKYLENNSELSERQLQESQGYVWVFLTT